MGDRTRKDAAKLRGCGRSWRAAIAVSATVLVLAACGTGPGRQAGEIKDPDAPLKLGLSLPALDTPFFSVLGKEAKAAAEAAGGSLIQTTNAKRDSGQQVTDFRDLITGGANAIMAGVVDTKAIKPALDYARSQGVPVVIVDDQPAAGDVYAVVKADNVGMAEQAAEALAALIPGAGKVLEISGDPVTTNGRDRQSGFDDTIRAKHPDISIIAQNGKWDEATGGSIASAILSQNPDLAGIYLGSDSLYFDSTAAALNGRGRLQPIGQPGHLPIVGIDCGTTALAGIRRGNLDACVSQPVDTYAKLAVQYLIDAREDKQLSEGPTAHGSEVVKVGNNLVDEISAPLVTRQNVDDPNLWANKVGR